MLHEENIGIKIVISKTNDKSLFTVSPLSINMVSREIDTVNKISKKSDTHHKTFTNKPVKLNKKADTKVSAFRFY